ncbi:MAG: LysR family transcriptional regulator [Proteobacteria bacterium]|nr:LysR family transcriptional regulator [Pseudomonadota bacterium]
MIDLDALRVLDAIDRLGSFEKAAQSLFRVRSAISYTIQKLEEDLDIQIFDRTKHKATLTPAGKLLLEQGRHLLIQATQIEQRIKQVHQGWEMELTIGIDTLYPIKPLLELIKEFYELNQKTFIKIQNEVYGGTWDALISQRANLMIGASGPNPNASVYTAKKLHQVERVFAIAPKHPLAKLKEPLTTSQISQYRSVAIKDTSRLGPPMHASYLQLQDILTVSDMQSKFQAQCLGLGVGFLPVDLAEQGVKQGKLVIKAVADLDMSPVGFLAWKKSENGKALKWFIEKIMAQNWAKWS